MAGMKTIYLLAGLMAFSVASCDKRGDEDEPYESLPNAFNRPNPGNHTGETDGVPQNGQAPGGALSGQVTDGAPSTAADGGPALGDVQVPASGGENEQNAAGSGNSSSVPTAGGKGTPAEKRQQEIEAGEHHSGEERPPKERAKQEQ